MSHALKLLHIPPGELTVLPRSLAVKSSQVKSSQVESSRVKSNQVKSSQVNDVDRCSCDEPLCPYHSQIRKDIISQNEKKWG